MDKSWVREHRTLNSYTVGMNNFLDYAFLRTTNRGFIKCPCRKCFNRYWEERPTVVEHLTINGMDSKYMNAPWLEHGETYEEAAKAHHGQGGIRQLLDENFRVPNAGLNDNFETTSSHQSTTRTGTTPEAEKFFKLVEDSNTDLYPGCTSFKKLDFIVELYHIKVKHGWSDVSFTKVLELFKKALPEGDTLPDSFYHTKKLIGELGLSYEKIDACPNDCMLFWPKDSSNFTLTNCSHCGASRWKNPDTKIAAKTFRYFPLKSRLQRLYMSTYTAESMTWHASGRCKDGVLRHPADSDAWKNLDNLYPNFGTEPRNVRLGLASDGFNPFGNMNNSYSTWPVVLCIYNLPPWMCTKEPYLILSSIISGPSGPGIDIDVYLQPLIDELKLLWQEGISTYDIVTNETFTLRAALLWTINDFPAYTMLSGWSTKGRYACPHCNEKMDSHWLLNGGKFCYMGHRRFIGRNHRYRKLKTPFDNNIDIRDAPNALTGSQCLDQMKSCTFTIGKGRASNAIRKINKRPWKKQSIFFTLPYWEHNLLRHNLDVMHIEKNVCESVIGTLLGIEGKIKDGPKARNDLKHMKIKKHLWPIVKPGLRTILPSAKYSLTLAKKRTFCKVLSSVKFPDGYASNLGRCVNVQNHKISGWKSHDYHVVMQDLLPLAMKEVLPKQVKETLGQLSAFFRALCSKTSTREQFQELSSKIALTLCNMEKIFPPAMFDIMVHLPVHLAHEAAIAGPVHYRWMYFVERYLQTLKSYVRNKARPEGCIAEGYLVEECLSFCSMYLHNIESKHNHPGRNATPVGRSVPGGLFIFATSGKPLGKEELVKLNNVTMDRAHKYVLFNCGEVEPYIAEHMTTLKRDHPLATSIELERIQKSSFSTWFYQKVNTMHAEDPTSVHRDLRNLARGPRSWAKRYKKYVVNGFHFNTKSLDDSGTTQNSGVHLTAQTTTCVAQNTVESDIMYYGFLTNVIELDYDDGCSIVLFDCEWVDGLVPGRGVKKDDLGLTFVNFSRLQVTDDTFILASQALQVYYVQDPVEDDWHMVVQTRPRDLYDVNE